jgi:hypothetical protein
MSDLELISVLEIVVFGLAIAQVLMIVLTFRRERDVKDLRELVEDQRLRLAELGAWLAGRRSSPARRIAEDESDFERTPVKTSESGMPLQSTSIPDDDLALTVKSTEWQRDIAVSLKSSVRAPNATTPTGAAFKWFKDDPNEPPELVEARRIISGNPDRSEKQHSAEGLATHPQASDVEMERALRAIRSLKDDLEKSSTASRQVPAANIKR